MPVIDLCNSQSPGRFYFEAILESVDLHHHSAKCTTEISGLSRCHIRGPRDRHQIRRRRTRELSKTVVAINAMMLAMRHLLSNQLLAETYPKIHTRLM